MKRIEVFTASYRTHDLPPPPPPPPRGVAGLLANNKTNGRVTGTGKDRWKGYWYRKRQVVGLLVQEKTSGRALVTDTGYNRW